MFFVVVCVALVLASGFTSEGGKKRTLYGLTDALDRGYLKRDGQELYYEVRGKRANAPVALWLHGGPGAGCFPNHARFFNPDKWRVCLIDQRGCGRSTPEGQLEGNNTPKLVEDLEALRALIMDDEPWDCVLGGSWGSTLALAYAGTHPHNMRSIVLRGVCAMRTKEIRWLFSPKGGAATLAPHAYRDFASFAEGETKNGLGLEDDDDEDRVLRYYHDALKGDDQSQREEAARHWMCWESQANGVASRRGNTRRFGGTTGDAPQPVAHQAPTQAKKPEAPVSPTTSYLDDLDRQQKQARQQKMRVFAQPLLTSYYSLHRGFFDEDTCIMNQANIDAIRHIPAIAVQGGADLICPPTTAFELHTKWPELQLRLVPGAGHSQYDPDITHELIEATDDITLLLEEQEAAARKKRKEDAKKKKNSGESSRPASDTSRGVEEGFIRRMC